MKFSILLIVTSSNYAIHANLWIAIPIGALITTITSNFLLPNYVDAFTSILGTRIDVFIAVVLGQYLDEQVL